jgi:hypothetical protein
VSKRTASWLAWSMCALSLALTALSLFLLVLNLSHPDVPIYLYWADNTLLAIGNSTVGAVIVPRLSPRNPIGWLFCATGLSFGVIHFSGEYVVYTLLAAPGSLPAGEALAWILAWLWVPVVGLQVFLLLLFPDGRLPSRRWRWFFWLSLLLILIGAVSVAFSPGEMNVGLGPIYNPLGVEGLPNSYEPVQALVLTLIFVSAASLFVRLRRARGVERQQIKWFAYTAMVASSGAILTYTVSEVIGSLWLEWVGYVLLQVGLIGIPISMGIAILRYRLYEIDLIINRTLVYGSLTAILALVYLGSVTALQYLLSLLTGQGNTLAIVVSTLAIAALFNPLRRRIQSFIDRRFYRRKYDAAKTLEAFASRLRYETDLERISEDLLEVVDETMQPSHISLWLRFPASSSPPKRSECSSSGEVRSSMQSEPPPQHPR